MPRKSRIRLFLGFLAVAALVVGGLTGGVSTAPASAVGTTAGGLFTPLQAYVLDTRHGVGGYPVAQFAAGHWYSVGIDGQGGVPTSNVAAVQVTFTAVNEAGSGVVHADKDGISNPNVTLPYATYGTTNISNTAVIPVGADGKIQVELTATADLIVNVQGYFTGGNAAGGGYVPVNATQIYNSGTTQYAAGASVSFPVAGQGGVPANASAVMLDVIEANGGTTAGYLTVYPAGSTKPTSSLNWPAGRNYEWTTSVPMNSTGNFTITVGGGSGSVSLSVGVEGYFTASDGTTSAGEFTSAAARVFNSASPSAPIASGASRTIQVAGIAGLPAMGAGIAAVAANIEISPGSGAQGHVQVFADDSTPSQPTQQFYSGVSTFAFDVVSLGADGGITIQNSSSGTINVVVDVEGWYQAPALPTPSISCPAPYSSGSWTAGIPDGVIDCTVTTSNGAYDATKAALDVFLDGEELDSVALDPSGQTSDTVEINPDLGQQLITASVDSLLGTHGQQVSYSLGFGDTSAWTSGTLSPDPENGATTTINPVLDVSDSNGGFPLGTQLKYSVSAISDGTTNPVLSTDWTDGDEPIDAGLLQPSTTYYWHATVQGPSDEAGDTTIITSPVWSFTTNDGTVPAPTADPILDQGTDASTGGQIAASAGISFSPHHCYSQTDIAHDDFGNNSSVHGRTKCSLGKATSLGVTTTLWELNWWGPTGLKTDSSRAIHSNWSLDAHPHNPCSVNNSHTFYGTSNSWSQEGTVFYQGASTGEHRNFYC